MEANKKSFYEQYKKEVWVVSVAVIGFSCIILIPLVVQGLIDWDTTHKGSDDGWLGFWGGYLGAIIGVAGALMAIQLQLSYEKKRFKKESTSRDKELEEEKQSRKSDQVDNTFFNLLNLFISQQNSLISEKNPDRDLFEDMLEKIKENSMVAYREQGLCYFYKNKSDLLFLLDKALKASETYVDTKLPILTEVERESLETMSELDWAVTPHENYGSLDFKDVYFESIRIKNIRNLKEDIENEKFFELDSSSSELFGVDKLLDNLNSVMYRNKLIEPEDKNSVMQIYHFLEGYTEVKQNVELEEERKKDVVEKAQASYHKQVGSYFRIFHRIIKYLNENVNDREIKKNYIGFLRANMNKNQMAMLFYNINYTARGAGAIDELKRTGFFGEKNELNDIKTAHFFSSETLVWGNYDLTKMQEFC